MGLDLRLSGLNMVPESGLKRVNIGAEGSL